MCSVNGVRHVSGVNGTPKKSCQEPCYDAHVAHLTSLLAFENTKQKWGKRFEAWRLFTGPSKTPRRIAGRLFVGHLQPGGGAVLLCRPPAPVPPPCLAAFPLPACCRLPLHLARPFLTIFGLPNPHCAY